MKIEKELIEAVRQYRHAIVRRKMLAALKPRVVLQKQYPALTNDFVSIQPMNIPAGLTEFTDYCFGILSKDNKKATK